MAWGSASIANANPHHNTLHDPTYALMTALIVVVSQALLVATFDRAAGEVGLDSVRRWMATGSVAFATLLWPLTSTFNPHPVSALLLLAGWRWQWVARVPRPWLAGFSLGLMAVVDLPIGLPALVLTLLLGPGRRLVGLGVLAPLLLHAALNFHIVGDVIPFQLHRQLYNELTGHQGAHPRLDLLRTRGSFSTRAAICSGRLGCFL